MKLNNGKKGGGEEMEKNMKWGTCEELLLGSAVERYGTQNWELVSKQLQARLPYLFFSPEACKAKYDALQGRFKCSGTSWLEELRRLRVAQLRRELQRSDDSIGSLRSRLERLQGESGKSGGGKGGGSKACSERSKDRSSAGSFTEVADGAQMAACGTPERKRESTDTARIVDKADGIQNAGGVRDRESNPSPVRETSAEERATAPSASAAADPDREEVAGSNPQEAQVAPNPLPAVPPPPPVHHPTSPLDSFYGSSETLADEENRKPLHDFVESKRANLRSKQRSRRPRANAWAVFPHQPKAAIDSEAELPKHTPEDAHATPAAHHDIDGCMENSGLQTVDTNASEKSFRRRRNQQGNKGSVVRSESSEEEGSAESIEEDKRVVDSDVLSSVLPPRESGKGLSSSHEDYMSARSSGDSHMEGEGAEEIETSPMSRRNRREPKVPGKLLPLLECLRSLSSHKFGPLFKHRLESQSKQQYRNMIRRHMDLGMIRRRLEEGTYSGSLEFFRDLLLIFNNALVYYPKSSQEHGAAWVLRQLATKEMETIFKTEALLKQEGPSTRKREPRKPSEPNSNASKFNPTSTGKRRNTRLASGGRATTTTGLPRSARLNYEQFPSAKDEDTNETKQENNKPEEPKDATDVASSAPPKPKPDAETPQKSEAATNIKKLKDGSRIVAEGQGKKVRDNIVKNYTSNFQPKKITGTDKDPRKAVSNEAKRDSSQKSNDEPKKPFGNIVQGSRALKKEQEEQESDPPPLKRGVGRPPKHAKKADDSTPSKSRKRAKR